MTDSTLLRLYDLTEGQIPTRGVCLPQWCFMALPRRAFTIKCIRIKVGLGHLVGMLSLFSSGIMQEAEAQMFIQRFADVEQHLSGKHAFLVSDDLVKQGTAMKCYFT